MPTVAQVANAGYDPYADVAGDAGWFGSDVVSSIGKVAKSVAKVATKTIAPMVANTLVPLARTALKNSGPWGMVANGAISAMSAGFSGKNIGEIAFAAAQGAAPSGIDTALSAARGLARGDSVLNTAIKTGAHAFAPGSGERFAYSVATDALRKGGTKADLGHARRALATEGQRRAFDSAIGMVATAARPGGTGMSALFKGVQRSLQSQIRERPFTTYRPTLNAPVSLSRLQRPMQLDVFSIPANRYPRWRALSPFAAKFVRSRAPFVSNVALIGDAGTLAGGAVASSMPLIKLIGDKQAAVSTLQLTLKDVFKPSQSVTGVYDSLTFATVKAFQASKGLTADGAVGKMTWTALELTPSLATPTTSPSGAPVMPTAVSVPVSSAGGGLAGGLTASQMPTIQKIGDRQPAVTTLQKTLQVKFASSLTVTGIYDTTTFNTVKKFQNARGLTVDGAVGPKTWAALEGPSAEVRPPVVASTPVVGDVVVNPAATIQAKAILAAWGKSDGLAEAGLQDYGSRAEDTSATIGPRDKLMITSFARWNNKVVGTSLPTDGGLSPSISDALRLWAERKAAAGVAISKAPTTTTIPTLIPTSPGISPGTTSPGIIPPGILSPGLINSGTAPIVLASTPGVSPGGLVVVPPARSGEGAPSTSPGIPPLGPEAPATSSEKDNTLAMAAGAGILGLLMGGIPGALIGAAAGAVGGSLTK